eukprot:TRINITY_DN1396_c0_g2_i3.p1 TRINITY_DN1396_c0_g2~~TRINITY_DN1396_c0_g2_i3.p1  ORF type:complete len:207 (+),score=26.77 TRINITY_DN1396_c0_g2_i3:44-664(+)
MSKLIFILSLFITLSFAQNYSWDYLLFVQQWPGTVCSGHCTPTDWTIHGLWPNRNDGSWPSYCPGPDFSLSNISSLVPSMKILWPDLEENDDNSFWSHEWSKHGTCAMTDVPLDTQFNFFSATLKLRQSVNLLKALSVSGITPGKSYTTSQIHQAIQSSIGFDPSLDCRNGNLQEIHLCVSKSLEFVNCQGLTDSCPTTVNYPALH